MASAPLPRRHRLPRSLSSYLSRRSFSRTWCRRGHSSIEDPEVTKPSQHASEGSNNEPLRFTFIEEPLGLPAKDGYGYPQLLFGEALGPGGRYVIKRKLGWGSGSSVWLARDLKKDAYVSIKALTGNITDLVNEGRLFEPHALDRLTSPPSPHCLGLLDKFVLSGRSSAKEHICLVTPLLGGDVRSLIRHWQQPVPFPLAKRILLHVLRGIAHVHRCGFVHTDLKPDNMFFDTALSTEDIDRILTEDPSRLHPPENSYQCVVQAAISQPLPPISWEESAKHTFLVGDFGSTESLSNLISTVISPVGLRAPEVYLGAKWGKEVDIWSFGCLVYELITNKRLFYYTPNEDLGMDEMEHMLYQMMVHTRRDFSSEQLSASPLAEQYFDSTGQLKKRPPYDTKKLGLYVFFKNLDFLGEEDMADTIALIYNCLALNPAERPTAEELLEFPLFESVE